MEYEYETSVGVVLNSKNQVLLGRCQCDDERNGMLCLPGGGIEDSEDVFAAALREVREETNVTAAISQMVFVTHSGLPSLAFVLMKDTGENSELIFNDEYDPSDPGGWFDLKNLPTNEILNTNLDILKTLGLIKKEVSYSKNNESTYIKSLLESGEPAEAISERLLSKTISEGTFDSKSHVAIYRDNSGDQADVYKRGSEYYAVVSGNNDYDMVAKNKAEMLQKLKRDGLTVLVAGKL